MSDFDDIIPITFKSLEKRIDNGEYITGKELADALQMNVNDRNNLMPKTVIDYYYRFLRGEISKGGKKEKKSFMEESREITNTILAVAHYHELLDAILRKRKSLGQKQRNSKIDSPATEAAKRVISLFYKNNNITADYFIKNIVGKDKPRK